MAKSFSSDIQYSKGQDCMGKGFSSNFSCSSRQNAATLQGRELAPITELGTLAAWANMATVLVKDAKPAKETEAAKHSLGESYTSSNITTRQKL